MHLAAAPVSLITRMDNEGWFYFQPPARFIIVMHPKNFPGMRLLIVGVRILGKCWLFGVSWRPNFSIWVAR